jgi:16S rRNA (uracil1498-N3)-methyltransferase
MRRFLAPSLPQVGETVRLDATASHHLLVVLRARPGERFALLDGQGHTCEARLVAEVEGRAELVAESPARSAAPERPLHLLIAHLKGDPMEHALRMAVEAGATHLHPIQAARSVPKGDRAERWARVAVSAAQQCGRADVPEVAPLRALREALAALPAGTELRVALPGAERLSPAEGACAVLVGPEGGWSPEEVRAALAAGARPMGLGTWVLRADTAAAVAVAGCAG